MFWTALMFACQNNRINVVNLLLEQKGIDVNARNVCLFYSGNISKK